VSIAHGSILSVPQVPVHPTTANGWLEALEQRRQLLLKHPLHVAITSPERLRLFCERHVYCVWDFMSLLKSLQRELTSTDLVWVPPRYPHAARLINEIVLGEETDEIAPGRTSSHFSWYLDAMNELGADTTPIRAVVSAVAAGVSPWVALETEGVPDESRCFTAHTLRLLNLPIETRLAVFLFAREDIIPGLFLPFVERLRHTGLCCETLIAYLKRHIHVDGETHGPMARQLLDELLTLNPAATRTAYAAAYDALAARHALWDRILERLESCRVGSLT
jgi:Protein of unknown function (DUF3050)